MASPTLPQLNIADFEPQIFWLLITFFLFYLVIKTKIAPYFFEQTERREDHIRNGHNGAKMLQEDADKLSLDYSDKIRAIHLRSSDLVSQAKVSAGQRLESEKTRMNNHISEQMKKYYDEMDGKVQQVDKELVDLIPELKHIAAKKLGIVMTISDNDNHILGNTKIGGY